jgi:Protein of unknown function (DUF2867)
MRLPNAAHTSRPWRIHTLTDDFRLEDVWALPTPGGPDGLPRLVQQFTAGDTSANPSRAARALFAIRWKVGALLGWDHPDARQSAQRPTLRDRLPEDLREAPGPDFDRLPFSSLYLLDDEWAAETVNRTVRGVMHIGWVADGTGGYRGQMAVLQAERAARDRLHGRDQALPAPDRVPAADAGDRAGLVYCSPIRGSPRESSPFATLTQRPPRTAPPL